MVLFGAGDIIEDEARAAHVLEFRVDLDSYDWQLLRAKDRNRACALDKCHYEYIPFK
jgi:hypothetical protein